MAEYRRDAAVAAALLVLAALLTGCAAMSQQLGSAFELPAQAPRKLDSPIGETGILLVNAEIIGKDLLGEQKYGLDSASIVNLADPGKTIRSGNFADGLVVFNGLAPGEYALVRVDGWRNMGASTATVKLPLPDGPASRFTITAGQAQYLGKLSYRDVKEGRIGVAQWAPEWTEDGSEETRAWMEVLSRYDDAPWRSAIMERMGGIPSG